MVTEMGSLDCSAEQSSRLLSYLDLPLTDAAIRISWGVRSWNQPGNCGYPSIIADWSGTPLGARGLAVHDHLQSYGTAAGAVMKRISAFVPSGACAPTCRPPANTVKC